MATVMDTNIPPSNTIYNIPQNDYRNNTFPPAPNQYQNQNYSYPTEEITYIQPQNQPMINNQYPPHNQQIIQQGPPPPTSQYNNIPLKKLSIDTVGLAKATSLHSAPPQINTTGSPFYNISSLRRHRGDRTNYESAIRAFFGRTNQHHVVYDINHTKPFTVIIDPKVDRGFFITENIWTCYRRNYFQISTVFNCFDIQTNEQIQLPCLVEVDKNHIVKVNSFSLGISSRVSGSDKKIDIIQHTPKRDKGPQIIPKPKPIQVGGSHTQITNIGNEQSMVTFERLQFKAATANNGKRRAAQQYYVLVLDLLGNTEEGDTIKIASVESEPLVVRGRSPGHYHDISINTVIPATVTMPSSAPVSSSASPSASATPLTDSRYRYPLTPTSLQAPLQNPLHTPLQNPLQGPPSMLRQPPLNYNSTPPPPMTTTFSSNSNPGTPTNANAGTPLHMAVTTAAGMAVNPGYALKEENITTYYPYGQAPHNPSSDPNSNHHVNMNNMNNINNMNMNMNMNNMNNINNMNMNMNNMNNMNVGMNMNMTPNPPPNQNLNGTTPNSNPNPNEYYNNSQSTSSLYLNPPNPSSQPTPTPQNYIQQNTALPSQPQPQPQPQPQSQPSSVSSQNQPQTGYYTTTNTNDYNYTNPNPNSTPVQGTQGQPQPQTPYHSTTFYPVTQTQAQSQIQHTNQTTSQTPGQTSTPTQIHTQNIYMNSPSLPPPQSLSSQTVTTITSTPPPQQPQHQSQPQPQPTATYITSTIQTTPPNAYLTPPPSQPTTTQQTQIHNQNQIQTQTPPQPNNYINGITSQIPTPTPVPAQGNNYRMDSPQTKLSTMDKNIITTNTTTATTTTVVGKESNVDDLNSLSSNKKENNNIKKS